MRQMLARDEREASVDQAADRLAYLVLSFGLLAVVAYRSFVDGEASWELLALVVVAGGIGAAYRAMQGVLSRQALMVIGVTVLAALILAALVRLAG